MHEGPLTLHAIFGDIAFIAMIWLFVELLEPSASRVARGKIASIVGFATTWLSWIFGGFYYVVAYPISRDIIKKGPWPWGHLIFMEVKEHVFLFGPFLATLALAIVLWKGQKLIDDADSRKSVLVLSGVVAVGALMMALMGMIITLAERVAVGGG